MFDGIDWNEPRAATGQVMRMLTCCEEIRKEKKRAVSARLPVCDFKSSSGTGDAYLDDPPAVQENL